MQNPLYRFLECENFIPKLRTQFLEPFKLTCEYQRKLIWTCVTSPVNRLFFKHLFIKPNPRIEWVEIFSKIPNLYMFDYCWFHSMKNFSKQISIRQ